MIRIWTIHNVKCHNVQFYIDRQTHWVPLYEQEHVFVRNGTRCIRNNSNAVTVSHSVSRGCRPWVGASLVGGNAILMGVQFLEREGVPSLERTPSLGEGVPWRVVVKWGTVKALPSPQSTCGQFASYWNAFLLTISLLF